MRRLMSVFLVSFSLLALTFVQNGNIPAVEASSSIRQGDLILTGNNVTVIEDRFDINGSIIVEENATLYLKDAFLNFTQTEDRQYNITFRNPSNGNPRLLAYNSTITSNFRTDVYLKDNSTATIDNSTIVWYLYMYDYSFLSIFGSSYVDNLIVHDYCIANVYNSTIDEWHNYHYSEVQVYDSEINRLLIGPRSINGTISKLKPGPIGYWSFIANSSVSIQPGGTSPNVTLVNVNVTQSWRFGFYGSSNVTILDSTIGTIFATDSSIIYLKSTDCSIATVQASSVLLITDSFITMLEIGGSLPIWLLNSTYTTLYFYDSGKVHVSWYLDVHVVDSIGQDVPSANVTATYPNATLAESKLTDANGWTRLTLMEKMVNATGEHPVGNYTVEATYEIYSDATTVNMTENKQITLTLEDFIIPEFPSPIILPLFMIATLLAVILYRRIHP